MCGRDAAAVETSEGLVEIDGPGVVDDVGDCGAEEVESFGLER